MKLMLLYRNLIILGLYNMSKKQSHYIQLDLIILLLFFMTISILAIYNAQQLVQYGSTNYALQQFIYYALCIMFAIALQFVDMEQLYISLYRFFFSGSTTLFHSNNYFTHCE